MPCSRHQGQRTDSLEIQFVILLLSKERTGRGDLKKRNPIIFICPSHHQAEKNANGRDSSHEPFVFHPEEGISFIAYRDFLFEKKILSE